MCIIDTQEVCVAADGGYQGNNTACDPSPCTANTGACCFSDGTCQELTLLQCIGAGAIIFQGKGTTCDPNPCPQPATGACCFNDGTCSIEGEAVCNGAGGAYEGNDTVCDPNPCPQPASGACCLPDETCVVQTGAECSDAGGSSDSSIRTPSGSMIFERTACVLLTRLSWTSAPRARYIEIAASISSTCMPK